VKGWGEKHQHREQKQQTNQKLCPKLPSHDAFILAGKNLNSRLVGKLEIHIDDTALGRSRPAADASREVVEHWLLDGFDVNVGHRRCSCDPSSQNDAGGTPAP
jgi:hypothetical protein